MACGILHAVNLFLRNAVLNTVNGAFAGIQDYSLGWAVASAAVSSFALSSTQSDVRVLPRTVDEAKQRDLLPMFLLGMAGWAAGRVLFPSPATIPTTTGVTQATPTQATP